jgi:hypothetical protein
VAGRTGVITLTKSDVGLGAVDNVADASKPVSTAQAAADALKLSLTGGTMTGYIQSLFASGTGITYLTQVGVETLPRFALNASGKMTWGTGSVAGDTNLYRSAADMLKTDDSLTIAGSLTVTGSATVTGALNATVQVITGTLPPTGAVNIIWVDSSGY